LNELSTADFTKAGDPLALFKLWLEEAGLTEINDPEAMTLATVDADGLPDARMVLCKGADQRGIVFYLRSQCSRKRRLFRLPAEGKPDRRLGEPAVATARRARRSRSGGGSLRAAVWTRRRAAARLLARLSA
jgi:Pyridoxamine 5'-phosphate oxidase